METLPCSCRSGPHGEVWRRERWGRVPLSEAVSRGSATRGVTGVAPSSDRGGFSDQKKRKKKEMLGILLLCRVSEQLSVHLSLILLKSEH